MFAFAQADIHYDSCTLLQFAFSTALPLTNILTTRLTSLIEVPSSAQARPGKRGQLSGWPPPLVWDRRSSDADGPRDNPSAAVSALSVTQKVLQAQLHGERLCLNSAVPRPFRELLERSLQQFRWSAQEK